MITTETGNQGVELSPPRPNSPLTKAWLFFRGTSLFLIVFCGNAFAHDPGLSQLDVTVADGEVGVHAIYARRDIEQLVSLDLSESGVLRGEDRDLNSLANRLTEIGWDKTFIKPNEVYAEVDESDAVHFRMSFPLAKSNVLVIRSSMLSRFSLGHRQFVQVTGSDGKQFTRILSAKNSEISIELPNVNRWKQFNDYLIEGIWHIWIGYDHILFVIALLLPAAFVCYTGRWCVRDDFKAVVFDVIKIVSSFTLAHSITLGLSVFEIVALKVWVVESLIAASVIAAALNNVFLWVKEKLWLLALFFGLIHGMGFAVVLSDLGLPLDAKALSLIAFNLGVEVGQLAIVAVFVPIAFCLRNVTLYRPVILTGGSYAIGAAACFWLIERLLDAEIVSVI